MQRKLFQKCTHLLHCSVLSLGGNVNTRRMLQPDMGSIFHIKKKINEIYSGHRKLLCELSKLSNLMLLSSSDTKRTLIWCIYSCLQIPPKENWFQYVRRDRRPQLTFLALHPWEGTNIKKQNFNYTEDTEGGT